MSSPTANDPGDGPNALRHHICEKYLRWVAENAELWTADRPLGAADLLLLTFFARSTRTYEAATRWLAERGFGEQALMLNRSLYEDMLDAHWISLNPDLAVQRMQEHDVLSRLLRARTQREFASWFDGAEPPAIDMSEEDERRLLRLFKGGTASWTGIGSKAKLEAILACWETEQDREHVRFMHAWVVKLMNEVLHPSAFSIARMGAPSFGEGERIQWRFGSTPEWLPQAMHFAFWTYSQMVGLVLERFAAKEQQKDGALRFAEGNRDFERAGRWEKTGVLDPPEPVSLDSTDAS